MTIVKSNTDLGQSKKLADILPLETADMHYNNLSVRGVNYVDSHHADLMPYMDAVKTLSGYSNVNPLFEVIPCWSLAALLDALPSATLDSSDDHHYRVYCNKKFTDWYDNSVDACYEMIIKLHELKTL